MQTEETQRYVYQNWDDVAKKFTPEVYNCTHSERCTPVKISEIIVPLMNKTNYFVEYSIQMFPEGFHCNNLTASLIYLNDSYKWEEVQSFPSSDFIY